MNKLATILVAVVGGVSLWVGPAHATTTTKQEALQIIDSIRADVEKVKGSTTGVAPLSFDDCVLMRDHGRALATLDRPAAFGRQFWAAAQKAGKEYSRVAQAFMKPFPDIPAVTKHLVAGKRAVLQARRADLAHGKRFGQAAIEFAP